MGGLSHVFLYTGMSIEGPAVCMLIEGATAPGGRRCRVQSYRCPASSSVFYGEVELGAQLHTHIHTCYKQYICIYTQRGWSLVFEVLRALVKRSTRKGKERKAAQGKEMEGAQGNERKGARGKGRVGTG
jgi:hypothetical protein